MYQRTRKFQDSSNENIDETSSLAFNHNNSFNSNNNHHYNNNHHHNNSHHHHHISNTIPANKDGKRYSMNEVFQVWNELKDQILNTSNPSNKENYKLSKPEPIYHLELQLKFPEKKQEVEEPKLEIKEDVPEQQLPLKLPESLSNLNISGITNTPTSVAATTASSIPLTTSGPPPGLNDLNLETMPLVTSDKIEWYYIDPSGNEQGPFNGDMMQEWLSGGYLNLDLKIRRKEETQFRTLQNLCDSLQNYIQPFKIPLIDLSVTTPSSSQFFPTTTTANNDISFPFPNTINRLSGGTTSVQNNTFNSILDTTYSSAATNYPSFLQQPALSRANSGWGIDTNNFSKPQTPVNQPLSPWLTNVSLSRTNSPFATTNTNTNVVSNEDDEVLNIHNSVVNIVDEEIDKMEKDLNINLDNINLETQLKEEKPLKRESPKHQPQVVPEPKKEIAKEPEVKQPEVKESKPSAPQSAPWAQKEQSNSNNITLKQMQELDNHTSQQRKLENKLKEEQQQAAAWAAANATTTTTKPKEAEKIVLPANWGTTPKLSITKTLADIQKEEAELAKLKQQQQFKSNTPKTSFASALANSIPKDDDSSWTTIAKKQPTPIKKPTTITTTTLTQSKTTPQLLRSVSANKSNTQTSSINSQSIREDFLIWARSQMINLYPSVSKDDLLEIFITLPSNQPDSISLIAETIYSSSATMDGRRFATEFLKRRQQVDKQIGNSGDHACWSSAIISSADKVQMVDEDGWSTSIKSKKKSNKRN
ncbi:unnamed protein product [Candida verbasci]|uniref:GYF domain-containing protein n=1 Tax=Candida verbasci TaxID=1227364 RepID=A0A9W4XB84_9ASCO|nr:unnamed protein product [Candida verbasci]